VDCGGTLRGLLDRSLIKIVGKKDEPGRPLLYGTTHRFLSLFNLGTLRQLPTLREYHELSEDSAEKLREFDGFPSIDELTEDISPIEEHDDTVADDLETAVEALGESENATRDALAAEGITLEDADERG
jgi:segregation and condensation protein B